MQCCPVIGSAVENSNVYISPLKRGLAFFRTDAKLRLMVYDVDEDTVLSNKDLIGCADVTCKVGFGGRAGACASWAVCSRVCARVCVFACMHPVGVSFVLKCACVCAARPPTLSFVHFCNMAPACCWFVQELVDSVGELELGLQNPSNRQV